VENLGAFSNYFEYYTFSSIVQSLVILNLITLQNQNA
jgi:hypothetical protein